jgi:hypothetical protein
MTAAATLQAAVLYFPPPFTAQSLISNHPPFDIYIIIIIYIYMTVIPVLSTARCGRAQNQSIVWFLSCPGLVTAVICTAAPLRHVLHL